MFLFFFFFFQAEDGIRDYKVTGVQTCALPISIDLALLPIGAYEPRWFMKDIHMNPAEAVQAHLDLAARQSIAMHFGTLQLTPEGIDEPVRELAQALRERGVPAERFRTVEVGESVYIHRSAAGSPLC